MKITPRRLCREEIVRITDGLKIGRARVGFTPAGDLILLAGGTVQTISTRIKGWESKSGIDRVKAEIAEMLK